MEEHTVDSLLYATFSYQCMALDVETQIQNRVIFVMCCQKDGKLTCSWFFHAYFYLNHCKAMGI